MTLLSIIFSSSIHVIAIGKISFLYLTEHKQGELQAEGEGEAGSLLSKDPDVGLNPRTLGSRPELKADT